jgi:glycosyltransferase involved in cell wall biosynthesis
VPKSLAHDVSIEARMRVAFVVPAYQAARTVGDVVASLRRAAPEPETPVIVIDDGSRDETARAAREAGAHVRAHAANRGKGAALLTGFTEARALGADAAVTVDADGQHPAEEALRVARHPAPRATLVLSVRDLARDGAPSANQFSNAFSNAWVSLFSRRRLADTQCGLRRYPLPEVLELGLASTGYELETEVIVKAARAGIAIAELPVRVVYPPEAERVTHFHSVRDPARIVFRLLHTAWTTPWRSRQA